MWKYLKKYLFFAVLAGLFMVGEVTMDLIQPKYMSRIVDEGVLGINNAGASNLSLIWHLGFQMAGLVLFGGLCGSLNNIFVHISGQNIGNEIRKDCFKKIMRFSFPQIDHFGTGSLITRVTNDITQVQNFVSQFVRGMIRTSLLTFGSIYCMFRLNLHFGLIILCMFPLILGCLVLCITKANPLFYKLQTYLDSVNAIMQEDISGIRIIKACVREVYEQLRFGKANENLVKTQLHILVIFALMNPSINMLMYIAIACILLAGSFDVSAGNTTPGLIMAATTYTTQLLNGVLMLVMLFQNISRGLASWKRIKEILYSEPDLKDGSVSDLSIGSIEFRDVSFSYPGSHHTVLSHINLTIHPGETLAIMGSTGCGKTSLVNLIPRFYDVTEGAVFINGIDVRKYNQQRLREKIAFVAQKSELFNTSFQQNILWGKPDADDNAVITASIAAQADHFISEMPDGYHSVIAEKGTSLSGGQKQRISIARALLKPAEIFVFDDSTSALDLKTEEVLYAAVQRTNPDSTKIIIAQRIASVRRVDRIVILENGKIVACDSHKNLMLTCQQYQDIYNSQIGNGVKAYEYN